MLFTEIRFVIFFVIVFVLYWAIRTIRARITLLILASLVFYGAWDWRFLGLILFVISVTYFAQKSLFQTPNELHKRYITTCSVVLLLGTLGIFKYFNFFADSLIALMQSTGFSVSQPLVSIILPVGISFYIFLAIGLIIDIRRGVFEKPQNFLDVTFFVAFFPQLVAGPIMRAKDFFSAN